MTNHKIIRCFGQDQDTGEECPEHDTCSRWINLDKDKPKDDERIQSMMRESVTRECPQRMDKKKKTP